MGDVETQWRQRVMKLLYTQGSLTTDEIGKLVPRPGRKRVIQLLKGDASFKIVSCRVSLANGAKKSRMAVEAARPVIKPTTLIYSHLYWDIILALPQTAILLSSWRWVWVLSQVNKDFRAALMRTDWIKSMCALDRKPLIWKKKANDLFALTADDMQHLECDVRCGTGFMRFKETHLMFRQAVLELGLAKHGGTFESINAVFLLRKQRRERRNRPAATICKKILA